VNRALFSRLPLRVVGRQIHWMPKTFQDVVVHHANRLHERVTNRRADKSAPLFSHGHVFDSAVSSHLL
jgi:hypothetical protein